MSAAGVGFLCENALSVRRGRSQGFSETGNTPRRDTMKQLLELLCSRFILCFVFGVVCVLRSVSAFAPCVDERFCFSSIFSQRPDFQEKETDWGALGRGRHTGWRWAGEEMGVGEAWKRGHGTDGV